ncbi:MAG TPA: hypothetical protein VJU84_06835 [Pyrinomonadaceae bacterium]|nr:hypothetical protein [Pyrinomonadaceae bacterium]
MPGKIRPSNLTIRAYQVGFGDCFLLSFGYPEAENESDRERHVLIDYGSTGMPAGIDSAAQMMSVANDIKQRCEKGKLAMVVATHRHKDHISGFTTKKDGSGTGDIIRSLKPDMVVQPWTEDPLLEDPQPAKPDEKRAGSPVLPVTNAQFVSTLADMNSLAGTMRTEMARLRLAISSKGLSDDVADEIEFLSEDNSLPNRMAVANLASMGKNHYVNFGYDLDVSATLPGVKIHVLGPPTLEQHSEIQKQKSRDENEFWMLQGAARSFWKMQAASSELIAGCAKSNTRLFPDADVYEGYFPSNNRWFIRRLDELRTEQLLGLVRMLDKSMNNTSVILLFEVGGKKLLFPGDAQIENWEFALGKKEVQDLLKDVTVYKVGHHGSRNATPKSLWNRFGHKDKSDSATGRLMTLNSTMKGKHGHSKNNSEVPRTTLVKELSNFSDYRSTEEAAKNKELFLDIPIHL